MFNSEFRGGQRCNGLSISPSEQLVNKAHVQTIFKTAHIVSPNHYGNDSERLQSLYKSSDNCRNAIGVNNTKVKVEYDDIEERITAHSIIGLSNTHNKLNDVKPPVTVKGGNLRATHHETLQRIVHHESDICNHYQHHWFSASLEKFKLEDRSREERIEITRHEFRRHIQQLVRSNVGQPNKFPEQTIRYIRSTPMRNKYQIGYNKLVAPKICEIDACRQAALPCAKHCTLHIMCNADQVLFQYCTAKFADNTQCSVPVFDISHELPLCPEHARKRDNYKLYQEAKPKKIRKKVKPSAMIRPQKRNKKKKKPVNKHTDVNVEVVTPSAILPVATVTDDNLDPVEIVIGPDEPDIVEEVLGLNEQGLVSQTTLLEDDINTVLSTIQADEFNDFFTVNRNGEYEPSREETEELEKALAAVDSDVKSLEKLSQDQDFIDSLLDEHTLAETLVHIPEMFHNGYTPCGDSMVTQTSSYLLPVQPHSHS